MLVMTVQGAKRKVQGFGFTLIELLVVISIIGVLATVGTVMYNAVREKTRRTGAIAEIRKVADGIALAQNKNGNTLFYILGNLEPPSNRPSVPGCTGCPCPTDLKNLSGSPNCIPDWQNALKGIQDTGGAVEGLTSIGLDPWGRPYILDQNEFEVNATDCRRDYIQSAGPDGVRSNACESCMRLSDPPGVPCTGTGTGIGDIGDDIIIKLPRSQVVCQPVAETCSVGL